MKVKDLIKYLQDKQLTGEEIVCLWNWEHKGGNKLVDLTRPAGDQIFKFKTDGTGFSENRIIALYPNYACTYREEDFQLSKEQ